MYFPLTAVVLLVAGLAAASAPPVLLEFLNAYAAGRYDESVTAAASIDDLAPLRLQFVRDVPGWIAADSAQSGARRAFAAAFLVELSHARLESDWGRLSDLVEWMCVQLRLGAASEFELAWHRASIALASRARERVWLLGDYPLLPQQRPPARLPPSKNPSPQHLIHALDRFPNDPQLRLARIVAWTWGRDSEPARNVGDFGAAISARRRASVADAIVALTAFAAETLDDKNVAAEARLRIGQLQFSVGNMQAALESFESAKAADAPVVRYAAHFLAGRTLETTIRPDDARREYEAALQILPGAESAAVALASLQFVHDDRAAAVALFQQTFERAAREDDPGRLASYGSYMHWPRLRDEMRARLRP
jgi:tetratricopeptide (TPR) repeat protein